MLLDSLAQSAIVDRFQLEISLSKTLPFNLVAYFNRDPYQSINPPSHKYCRLTTFLLLRKAERFPATVFFYSLDAGVDARPRQCAPDI